MCGWCPASIPTGHSWAKSQGRRISSRSFQRALSFSCEPCLTVSHCPGATRPLVRRRLIWFPAHMIRLTCYGFICLRLYGVAVMSCRSPVGNAPHILPDISASGSRGNKSEAQMKGGGTYPMTHSDFITLFFKCQPIFSSFQ